MVIFLYNLYIFGIHLLTMSYLKPCYNKLCYKEINVYLVSKRYYDCAANINTNTNWWLQHDNSNIILLAHLNNVQEELLVKVLGPLLFPNS